MTLTENARGLGPNVDTRTTPNQHLQLILEFSSANEHMFGVLDLFTTTQPALSAFSAQPSQNRMSSCDEQRRRIHYSAFEWCPSFAHDVAMTQTYV